MSQWWGCLQWAKKNFGGWRMLLSWLLFRSTHVLCTEGQLHLRDPVTMKCVALTPLNPDPPPSLWGRHTEGHSWMSGNHGQACVAAATIQSPGWHLPAHRWTLGPPVGSAYGHWCQEGTYISHSSESPFHHRENIPISFVSSSLISIDMFPPTPLPDGHFTLSHFLSYRGEFIVSSWSFICWFPWHLFLLLLSAPFLALNLSFPFFHAKPLRSLFFILNWLRLLVLLLGPPSAFLRNNIWKHGLFIPSVCSCLYFFTSVLSPKSMPINDPFFNFTLCWKMSSLLKKYTSNHVNAPYIPTCEMEKSML